MRSLDKCVSHDYRTKQSGAEQFNISFRLFKEFLRIFLRNPSKCLVNGILRQGSHGYIKDMTSNLPQLFM